MMDIQVDDALDIMKGLYETGDGSLDLIFLYAEKTQYSLYLEWATKLC
ncbi:MAG: hypothetical protein V3R33_06710 [Anaerolineales bacterium]